MSQKRIAEICAVWCGLDLTDIEYSRLPARSGPLPLACRVDRLTALGRLIGLPRQRITVDLRTVAGRPGELRVVGQKWHP